MTDQEIIFALAGGSRIYVEQDGFHGNSYELRDLGIEICGGTVSRLVSQGWIEGPNTYRLTDAGFKSYLRSADELGDGKLVPPNVK